MSYKLKCFFSLLFLVANQGITASTSTQLSYQWSLDSSYSQIANPVASSEPLKYGFYALTTPRQVPTAPGYSSVSFFGAAAPGLPDCVTESGDVTDDPGLAPALSSALSRTHVGFMPGSSFRWAPRKPDSGCSPTDVSGNSFAVFTKGGTNAGVGLYTANGTSSTPGFFKSWGAAGEPGTGANQYISGSFYNLFAKGQNLAAPYPVFSTDLTSNLGVSPTFMFEFSSGVYFSNIQSLSGSKSLAQGFQYVKTALTNLICIKEGRPACTQNRHLIVYINRRDYDSKGQLIDTASLYQNAHSISDPVQNNAVVLSGPILAANQTTSYEYPKGSGRFYPVWTSRGNGTVFDSNAKSDSNSPKVNNLTFRYEVSWIQFENFLRIHACEYLIASHDRTSCDPMGLESSDLIKLYGSAWNVPSEWVFASIGFGQEVRNPIDQDNTYLGGALTSLRVTATKAP